MGALESRVYRWLIGLSFATSTFLMATLWAGQIEGFLFPIRENQKIVSPVRTNGRLCWGWESDKLKPARSDNIDVWLTDPSGERSSVSVFAEATGQPWRLNGSAPAGHQEVRMCVLVPPYLKDASPATIEQVILYHGWHDLWLVPVRVPDVVFPPLT